MVRFDICSGLVRGSRSGMLGAEWRLCWPRTRIWVAGKMHLGCLGYCEMWRALKAGLDGIEMVVVEKMH